MAGARPPGVQGGSSSVSEIDAGTLCRGPSPAPGPVDTSQAPLTSEQQALLVDVAQIALDIVGIVDPTPIADATNAAISAARSDWTGAGVSLLGIIPFVGDAAKAVKVPRWLATVNKCIDQARRSQRFANLLRPLLTRVYYALDGLPLGAMSASLRGTLRELQARIASIVGASGRAKRAARLLDGLRARVDDPDLVLDTIEAGLQRGAGTSSLPVDDFLADLGGHLANFEGKPTLRFTRHAESAVRASDTIGGKLVDPRSGRALLQADDMGRYLVPGSDLARGADRNASAVAPAWNKMSAVELQEIPAGSLVLEGVVRAQANLAGGGRQLVHLGQLSSDGRVLKSAERRILDGVTRLPGGSLSGTH